MITNLEPLTKEEIRAYAAHYDQAKPAIYCGTYHKYNCGSLYGMWVDITSFDNYSEFCDFCRSGCNAALIIRQCGAAVHRQK